jgi:hypothetical protein
LTSPIPHGEWEVEEDDKAKERESAAWRKVVLKLRGKFKVPMPKVTPESLKRLDAAASRASRGRSRSRFQARELARGTE